MSNNIFNISQEYLDIMSLIEANDGEVTSEIQESLKINKDDLDKKMDSYAYIITMKNNNNNMLKDEIDRLNSIQRVNNNIVKRLKTTIIDTMRVLELNGKSGNLAYRTEFHNFYTRETEAIELVNEEIPQELIREYKEEFGDLLTYKVTKPLTIEQLITIENALLDIGKYEGFIISASISKTNLKEAINNASYLEAEEVEESNNDITNVEFETLSDRLAKLGKIVNNTSLTIK